MSERDKSDEFFRRELYTLLIYSSLLKKKRNKKADEEVKKVLEEEKTIVARINRIKEIDEKYEKEFEEELETEKIQKVIEKEEEKTKITKTPLLNYIFGIRKPLFDMVHNSGILKPKFFGLSFKVTSETLALLEEIRVNAHNTIFKILWEILEKGWVVLHPLQYNLFYYFYDFLVNYVKNFNIDDNINSNFNFIQTFLSSFLVFFSKKYYLQEMREGAYIYYGNKENDDLLKLLLFIEGITDTKKTFSFTNYISMIYSAYYRKIISFKKVTELKETPDLSSTKYMILPKLKDFIQDYINKTKAKLKVHEKRLFKINYVLDDNIIEKMVKKYSNPRFDPNSYKIDILSYTKDIINTLLNYAKPLLTQSLTLKKDSETVNSLIFKFIFDNIINNTENIGREINYIKENYKFLLVPIAKFEEYTKQGKKLESEKDEKICFLIDSATKNIFELFETLVTILYNHHKTFYESSDIVEKIKTKTTPLVDITKEGFLPYYDYKPVEYNNETVWEIASNITLFCGNYLFKMNHPKILEEVNLKETTMETIKSNVEVIARFTDID